MTETREYGGEWVCSVCGTTHLVPKPATASAIEATLHAAKENCGKAECDLELRGAYRDGTRATEDEIAFRTSQDAIDFS